MEIVGARHIGQHAVVRRRDEGDASVLSAARIATRSFSSHQRSIGPSLSTPLTMIVALSGMRNRSANSAREATCGVPVARLTNS